MSERFYGSGPPWERGSEGSGGSGAGAGAGRGAVDVAETAELPDVSADSDEVPVPVPVPEAAVSEAAVPEAAESEAARPDDGATARDASDTPVSSDTARASKGSGAGSGEPGGSAGSGGAAEAGGLKGPAGPGGPDGPRIPGSRRAPDGLPGAAGPGGDAGSGGAGGTGGGGNPRWPGGFGDGAGDGGDDEGREDELRLLLHSAVDGLEPAPGTLQYLQRAVPARRTRRRQLVAVAAVAVVALAVSVPALMMNVAGSTSEKNPRQDIANSQLPGAGQQGGGGAVEGNDSDATAGTKEPGGKEDKTEPSGEDENTAAPTGGSEGTTAAEPCAPAQVSEPVAARGTPDGAGRVTGSFTVTNVSATACEVESSDGVRVGGTFGAASASAVDTRTHTAGDAATDLLPAPETTGTLVLAAGESYVVEFAWVPEPSSDGGCTSTATTPAPDPSDDTQSSPDETQSETDQGTETGGDTGGTGGTGGTGEPGGEGDGTTDGSVTLTHSPEADSSAVASVTVENACAGTVYYTEPLPSA
ncbi:hypothetical protein ACHZ98_24480 [Streptomyces sp. MAR4 CNY-716]